ncbi:MAG: archaemetzincin family Zn-dependent metalloprotease [Bacteroidales bacterium]|nr:archaemetzincin family Zn-dependent metalloprotease [Bacteroidales bacterium]
MNAPAITILSFGRFERGFLEKISEVVMQELNCAVTIKEAHVDISEFYDPVRRQYNGNKLLHEVDSLNIPGNSKTIGLLNVDLYIPILTFIFGQAQLGGRSAIASQYRLSNERYGMPADEDLLLKRLAKEVIHELGHTLGLIHCHTPTCVMRSSTYVEDIDQKEAQLCAKCRGDIANM